MFLEQRRADALDAVWSIKRASQLSGRHSEPVCLCEEHSRRVNTESWERVLERRLLVRSPSGRRTRFQQVTTFHSDTTVGCIDLIGSTLASWLVRSGRYRRIFGGKRGSAAS